MDEMAEPQSDLRYGADDVDAVVGTKDIEESSEDDMRVVVDAAVAEEDGIGIAKTRDPMNSHFWKGTT